MKDTVEEDKAGVALDLAIDLILADLKAIENQDENYKLPHDWAQDLCRYHSSLIDRKFSEIQDTNKKLKSLGSLSTEEYFKQAEQDLKKYKREQALKNRAKTTKEPRNEPDEKV